MRLPTELCPQLGAGCNAGKFDLGTEDVVGSSVLAEGTACGKALRPGKAQASFPGGLLLA